MDENIDDRIRRELAAALSEIESDVDTDDAWNGRSWATSSLGRWAPIAAAAAAVIVVGLGVIGWLGRDGADRVASIERPETNTSVDATAGPTPATTESAFSEVTSPPLTSVSPSTVTPSTEVTPGLTALCADFARSGVVDPTAILSCDAEWAAVGAEPRVALWHRVDALWTELLATPPPTLCRDDLRAAGVPGGILDALAFECDEFDGGGIVWQVAPINGLLGPGDEGPRVRALQRFLADTGLLAATDLDGEYGQRTRLAVIEHQLADRSTPTGLADAQLLGAAGLDIELVLSRGGLGAISFGADASDVTDALARVLGPPTADRFDWIPRELSNDVDGDRWVDDLSSPAFAFGHRFVERACFENGLEVVFGGDVTDELRLVGYSNSCVADPVSAPVRRLATASGLQVGAIETVGERSEIEFGGPNTFCYSSGQGVSDGVVVELSVLESDFVLFEDHPESGEAWVGQRDLLPGDRFSVTNLTAGEVGISLEYDC